MSVISICRFPVNTFSTSLIYEKQKLSQRIYWLSVRLIAVFKVTWCKGKEQSDTICVIVKVAFYSLRVISEMFLNGNLLEVR